MKGTMLVIRSSKSLGEGLRLCAAMLGMDESPFVVFIDEGVQCLQPDSVEDPYLVEYLQTAADIAGVYVLKESLIEQDVNEDSLDPALDAAVIDVSGFTDLVIECKTVTTF